MTDAATAIADTRRWLERAVIGLNLCPFAKGVHAKGQVHYAVATEGDAQAVLRVFRDELQALLAADPADRDTTLLIVPSGQDDFHRFHALVGQAERIVRREGLEGVVQVAHFHPAFVFADADEDDIANATNRAPYPTLHLLREASIDRAVAAFPDAAAVYEANIRCLRELGPEGWRALDVGPSS